MGDRVNHRSVCVFPWNISPTKITKGHVMQSLRSNQPPVGPYAVESWQHWAGICRDVAWHVWNLVDFVVPSASSRVTLFLWTRTRKQTYKVYIISILCLSIIHTCKSHIIYQNIYHMKDNLILLTKCMMMFPQMTSDNSLRVFRPCSVAGSQWVA